MAFPPGNIGFSPLQLTILRQKASSSGGHIPVPVPIEMGGTNASTINNAQTNLGVKPGTNIQSFSAVLQDISILVDPDESKMLGYDSEDHHAKFFEVGTNLSIDDGVLNKSGSGGGGVTEVDTGYGLTGGPITSTGTISRTGQPNMRVLYAENPAIFSMASSTFTAIPSLSITSITPNSLSSKFLIFSSVSTGWQTPSGSFVRLVRDSTPINVGDAAGSRISTNTYSRCFNPISNGNCVRPFFFFSLDAPATLTPFKYELQIARGGGAGNVYVNRSSAYTGTSNDIVTSSSLTVIEVW